MIASPTADPGVASLILARFHTFMEIDHGHSPPSADSRTVVSYKQKYVHEVLIKGLIMLDQEKEWLGDHLNMTIAVDWDLNPQTKSNQKKTIFQAEVLIWTYVNIQCLINRVAFGPNHLYVFHDPQGLAKKMKAGEKIEVPTFDTANEEIAKSSGLMGAADGKSKGEKVFK